MASLDDALKKAPALLMNCNFIVRMLVFSDKSKKNFDTHAHHLGDAISIIKEDLVKKETPHEQRVKAAEAITALLEALGAAATVSE